MKTLIISVIVTMASVSIADVGSKLNVPRQIKVAVIDTGIDKTLLAKDWLCKDGHKDFTNTGLHDNHGHGTHIAGLIEQYAKDVILTKNGSSEKLNSTKANFCLVIIKYFDPSSKSDNLLNTIRSIEWAIKQNVDVINYSGGGTQFSAKEKEQVIAALNKGIKFVAAAGNERSNIDEHRYYPAMYDNRIFVVGNLVKSKVRLPSAIKDIDVSPTSNWGSSVNTWEVGTNILSRLLGNSFGFMTGTSQACAIKSGKMVREMLLKQ